MIIKIWDTIILIIRFLILIILFGVKDAAIMARFYKEYKIGEKLYRKENQNV